MDSETKGLPAGVSRGQRRSRFQLPFMRRGSEMKQTTEPTTRKYQEFGFLPIPSAPGLPRFATKVFQAYPSLVKANQAMRPSHAPSVGFSKGTSGFPETLWEMA